MSEENEKTICEYCKKECNLGNCGNAIAVDFPYGHELDSMDRLIPFCSDDCLINYIKNKGVIQNGSNISVE